MAARKKNEEQKRLDDHYSGKERWLDWGPYLSERQWGTVREDYSPNGQAWSYLPHDHARSRAYRWGEDGLMGISDIRCKTCFSLALWNGQDPIIKERLFGLNGNEGNHAEDVKELYYYLDSTPTHSYMKTLYKYPHAAFPYQQLVEANARLDRNVREYEITDTGVFDDHAYFDVFSEYAKITGEDTLIKITVANRSKKAAPLYLMPTLWFRNVWEPNPDMEKPVLKTMAHKTKGEQAIAVKHPTMEHSYYFYFAEADKLLFTENETNRERIFGQKNKTPFVKDAINDAVIQQDFSIFKKQKSGTKVAAYYHREMKGGEEIVLYLRITNQKISGSAFGPMVEKTFTKRKKEADQFYETLCPASKEDDLINIQRQAYAGMMWTKQFYYLDVNTWLDGDPSRPNPPEERKRGRNSNWRTLNNKDIISMPDKWEYPWYAAWDLAFHCVPLAELDLEFTKHQLLLFLREWFVHPNGQLPAYEWSFGDVNPPVHAWGCLEVYKIGLRKTGKKDIDFLKQAFQKLLINFTWWVNQKDSNDNNIFEGGFLGLDNIGVFDRSHSVPGGGVLDQADGTAWMGMYCLNMLEMAIEIALVDRTFEDVATKFYEHFILIAASLNEFGEGKNNAWDEDEGFFYDVINFPNKHRDNIPVRVRSLVGLSTLFATFILEKEKLQQLPDFYKRLKYHRNYRVKHKDYLVVEEMKENEDILLSLLPKRKVNKLLEALLDPKEFLSPYGIRSLSKIHKDGYHIEINGSQFGLSYEPGESRSSIFGGNSNWRGPIWFPMNYLLIRSLRTYHEYFGKDLKTRLPVHAKTEIDLDQAADKISNLLIDIFRENKEGFRPVYGPDSLYERDPYFKDLILFFEYFHGDEGEGLGASHQTGWTGLVATLIGRCGGE